MNTEAILSFIRNRFDLPADFPVDKMEQDQISGWDSLANFILLLELEKELDVSFNPEDIPELTSVKKILETLDLNE